MFIFFLNTLFLLKTFLYICINKIRNMAVFFKTEKKVKGTVVIQNPVIINVKDKDGKIIGKKKIQYVEGYDTIDYNDQIKIDKNVVATPIAMRKGIRKVYEDEPMLLEFFRQTSQNTANGGNMFHEVDVEKEADYQLEQYEIYDKAIDYIRKATQKELRAFAIWFLGVGMANKKIPELKLLLRQRCQNDIKFAQKIIDYKSDKNTEVKSVVALALAKGVIKQFANKIKYPNDSTIFVSQDATTLLDDYAVWLSTKKEGKENLTYLLDQLK